MKCSLFHRGEFDKRLVAVKRILPECFDLADREVSQLVLLGIRIYI